MQSHLVLPLRAGIQLLRTGVPRLVWLDKFTLFVFLVLALLLNGLEVRRGLGLFAFLLLIEGIRCRLDSLALFSVEQLVGYNREDVQLGAGGGAFETAGETGLIEFRRGFETTFAATFIHRYHTVVLNHPPLRLRGTLGS